LKFVNFSLFHYYIAIGVFLLAFSNDILFIFLISFALASQ